MKSCFLILLGVSAVALAQPPAWNFARGFRGLFAGKTVTGEPYSATGLTTRTQTLSNGNAINQSSCAKLYRDSAGRTRREETRNSATCSATPTTISISDPVAGVAYVINPQSSTYRQFTIKAPQAGTTPQAVGASNAPRTRPANPNEVQTALGAQAIPGTSLSAQGTQTVRTIPAGTFGNAQPITITSVRWYSPDLQIVTQSSRTDPREGTVTYQISNVLTAEPEESLFQLPSGLTLQQGRPAHVRPAP
jgi:hypothetical protein